MTSAHCTEVGFTGVTYGGPGLNVAGGMAEYAVDVEKLATTPTEVKSVVTKTV